MRKSNFEDTLLNIHMLSNKKQFSRKNDDKIFEQIRKKIFAKNMLELCQKQILTEKTISQTNTEEKKRNKK